MELKGRGPVNQSLETCWDSLFVHCVKISLCVFVSTHTCEAGKYSTRELYFQLLVFILRQSLNKFPT